MSKTIGVDWDKASPVDDMGRRHSKKSATGILLLLALLCPCAIPASAFNAMEKGNYAPAGMLCLFVLAVFALLFAVLYLLSKSGKQRSSFFPSRLDRQRQLLCRDIEQLTGLEFEHYLAALLERRGYAVKVTPPSGDLGIDLVAQRGAERIAIQAKKYANPVPRNAVSDAVAGMKFYNCNRAMVITNSSFSKGARELASATNCELVDGDMLANWLAENRDGTAQVKVKVASFENQQPRSAAQAKEVQGIASMQDRNLSEYGHRNRLLSELGYTSYEAYLRSPIWNSIREQVRQRDQNICRACASRGCEVHHLRYDRQTLLGRDLNWLITLCRECHEWIEHDAHGNKLSISAANRQLEALLSRAMAIDASLRAVVELDSSSKQPVPDRNVELTSKRFDFFEESDFDEQQETEELNPGSSPSIDPLVLALVFHRDKQRCRVCRSRASEIYGWGEEERRITRDIHWLISICSKCFRDAWHKSGGELCTKAEADEQLAKMVKEADERRSLSHQSRQLMKHSSQITRSTVRFTGRLGSYLTRWLDS